MFETVTFITVQLFIKYVFYCIIRKKKKRWKFQSIPGEKTPQMQQHIYQELLNRTNNSAVNAIVLFIYIHKETFVLSLLFPQFFERVV